MALMVPPVTIVSLKPRRPAPAATVLLAVDAAPVKAIAATARAAPTNFFLLRMRVTPLVLNSRPGSEK